MTNEFKINVYFNEKGKDLESLVSQIILNTLLKNK